MIPEEFKKRMKRLLGGEYEEFLAALEQERYQALRVNPLKMNREEFLQKAPFSLTPVPWEENGFYYGNEGRSDECCETEGGRNQPKGHLQSEEHSMSEESTQPGKHPWHEAGVYYIQEPSAMAAVPFLGAQPGERILDLCAAPGGKSTQIAAAMRGEGLLVCNEIHPARAGILSENIERMGVRNALVLNETPDRLAERFPGFFDRILVDAPCSGEGMFRKNEAAGEEWSPENVEMCAKRQRDILECAYRLLRPGGRLCYSTCTFAPAEDEGSISRLVNRHPDMRILPVGRPEGFSPGRPEWVEQEETGGAAPGLEHTMRLWPHRIQGEGHYVAVLEKEGTEGPAAEDQAVWDQASEDQPAGDHASEVRTAKTAGKRTRRRDGEKGLGKKDHAEFTAFAQENLQAQLSGIYLRFGDQLYLAPEETPLLRGLKVLRPGLHLGTVKKNRFEPSHALALTLSPKEVRHVVNLDTGGRQIKDYLNGLTFPADGEKGWYLICADGCSLGWGKLAGGTMKNHYPRGLRKNW
ncbi:MAG TPA: RsmF rRNA methyltransferase first C-terminal domain-containing protein [Candidatus Eisenbergiella merdipullorum]|uniref:RsmF rRNA methyltransferase first C-terminal domain-containing protein n=1 Tax=Candidatus Eisenbergiella merdipullorum TaxID=2838553 RepID=A0A9D2I486_9FIRM|nr:RsmF rRNA methyltransferase first C-terminal domain-containing protein [Candidatus Eisenbergiella merdipullorum]